VVAYALRLLGVDPHHADGLSVRYDSGSVRDRVKSALAEVTP
jgi:hypothetical protein